MQSILTEKTKGIMKPKNQKKERKHEETMMSEEK